MTPRDRYKGFNAPGLKIHPLKRLAGFAAACLPPSWRFRLLGLPPRARPAARPAMETEASLLRLENGIACHNGAHLDATGAYVPDMTLGAGSFIESRFLQRQRAFPRVRKVAGALLSLAGEGHLNYYRWLMETLPRMRFVTEPAAASDWIYACQKETFHRISLRLLGCDFTRLLPSERERFVQADRIVMPRFVNEAEPWIIPWLREQFLPPTAGKGADFPRRIYITRARATGRRVTNEEELLEKLAPLGFVAVALEAYDWLDQLALFHRAEAVIGPHGAGLANLIFCSPGARVIELIAPGYAYTFYPEISRQVGLQHQTLVCEASDPQHVHRSDLLVKIDRVLALTDQ